MLTTLQQRLATMERLEIRSALVLTSVIFLMVIAFLLAQLLLSILPGYTFTPDTEATVQGHISMMMERLQGFYQEFSSHDSSVRIGRNLINSSFLE